MKKILLVAGLIACACSAMAQVPEKISFQGYLTDEKETPIQGPKNFLFLLYKGETGGTAIWSEAHNNVQVVQGLYNVNLGSVGGNFDTLTFAMPYFLEVQIVTGAATNDILKPRIALTSAGYSVSAVNASTITKGRLPNARLDPDLVDLAEDGELSASKVGPGLSPAKIAKGNLDLGNGTLAAGAGQFSSMQVGENAFAISSTGDITKIKGKTYSFPDNYTTASVLLNNGQGALTWQSTLPVTMGGTGSSVALSGVVIGGPSAMTGLASTAPNQYLRRNAGNSAYEFGALSITNNDISGSANIADGKLATISTAGKVSGNAINTGTITGNTAVSTSGDITTSGTLTATTTAHVGNGTTGNLIVDGFTKMGADGPSIKVKVFTGTTPNLEGFDTGITLSPITPAQIISVQAMIDKNGSSAFVPVGYTIEAECLFGWYMTATQIRLAASATSSANLMAKAYRVVVIYQQ